MLTITKPKDKITLKMEPVRRGYRSMLYYPGLPKWFTRLTNVCLAPILLWPLVLLSSVFLFDTDGHFLLKFGISLAMNSYPLFLFSAVALSRKYFFKMRWLAVGIPILLIAVYSYGFYALFINHG